MATCHKCSKPFIKDDSIIVCDVCGCDYHVACAGVAKTVFKSISRNKAFAWKCATGSFRPWVVSVGCFGLSHFCL